MEKKLLQNLTKNTILKTEANFYKLLAENLGEEITVSDGDGNYLFVNKESVEMIGMPVYEIIGKNAKELEDLGYFSRSVTLEVLEKRTKVSILQKMKNGRTIIATGAPVFTADGENIALVISTSKDIEEVNSMVETIQIQETEISLKNAEIEKLRDEVFSKHGFLYADPLMGKVRDIISKIAPLDIAVLIEGETGVGKEVVANALHQLSDRADKPFVKINCGIIPESLIEAELFGYEEGAFTGASRDGKKGLVELADKGTLFLDEIGEMPLHMQVKLLDFLQDNSFKHVGGTEKKVVDTRILAATNRDLNLMCEKGMFRKDLYYRLKVMPINIPPLRERTRDIRMLTKSFITDYNRKYGANKVMHESAYVALCSYDWPGNVRELQHVTERAFIMSSSSVIDKDSIIQFIDEDRNTENCVGGIFCPELMPLKDAKHELERQLVNKAMSICKTTYKAAEALKVDQSTIVKILKRTTEY